MAFPATVVFDGADPLAWLRARRDALEESLAREGAVLLRGLPLATADDFDAVVRVFDRPNFAYRESLSNAVRVERTERVFTANEAPPEAVIRLHHELAQTPRHPARLYFFCEKPAEEGGATPLCRSDRLYEAIARERPDFARDCATHGLLYRLVMPPADDAGSGQGRSWRSTFATETREGAEARMRRLGYAWEWLPGDCLSATTPVLPAVRTLPDGRKAFFNQLIATLGWSDARNEDARSVTLGNGRPLDAEALRWAGEQAEALCVDLQWQRGDVALVDNFRVMHGRRSFCGTRRVLASLAD
ncbi:MAG: TauD/TfdA family dioxygenase [Myxococcota bacterium]